ncbi:MAG TPA: potassium channel family protein [Thermoleophilaceae bacterium]|nr:potassium channel family protein [Thermoleophilaceae bacterium]
MSASTDGPGRRQRFGLVLIFITASFMVEGTLSGSDWAQVVVTALLGSTLLLTFWAADMPSHRLRLAAAGVAAAVAAVIVTVVIGDHTAAGIGRLTNAALVALAPPMLVVGMLRSVRRHKAVTLEAVLGGLALYVLVGMLFAFVYGAIDNLGGEPFFAQGVAATPERCNYFSFSTLTTVGFGDLTARGDLGRTLAVFEALVGQLYLVTVVSVGVSNLAPRARAGGDR